MSSNDRTMDRRRALKGLSLIGAGAALAAVKPAAAADSTRHEQAPITDRALFTFALNLEYLEAEYYLRATTGAGIPAADIGAYPGPVTGGSEVPFATAAFRQYAEELAANELAHVRYYRASLGRRAIDRPAIDFTAGFAAAGKAAGLGDNFNPFADEISFFLGGFLFEDVGVTAYKGGTRLISNPNRLED